MEIVVLEDGRVGVMFGPRGWYLVLSENETVTREFCVTGRTVLDTPGGLEDSPAYQEGYDAGYEEAIEAARDAIADMARPRRRVKQAEKAAA